ncbi:MAG: efflux RND transporter periplasmic adaptor subunit [Planctomycetes bacterium]|nr:efflux RND transporter periplasmic adaptor subunit [Planctomycetota bacterium]
MLDEPTPGWVSVSALQCRLRELFASKSTHRAAASALQEIGALLGADYAVMHARVGFQPVSEEWSHPDFALRESLREQVNIAMMAALEADEPRCIRIGSDSGDIALTAAVIYGADAEQAGSVGLLFRDCDRAHAFEAMSQLESLVGFLALLLSQVGTTTTAKSAPELLGPEESTNPLRLLLQLVSELGSRYGLDQIAVGLVDGCRVRVALVNNELDLRPSNPGVKLIRDAMCECLDVAAPIRVGGGARGPEFRLHEAWRRSRGDGVVASVPLTIEGDTIAVIAMASANDGALGDDTLRAIAQEFESYAQLLPMARMATRSLARHGKDVLAGGWRRLTGSRHRFAIVSTLLLSLAGWLAFGSLHYRLTVPCVVAAMDRRIISCPRDGVLAELYVRPGDQVIRGQLLAELDSHDDQLTKAELEAEVASIEAQIDVALGEYDSGKLRVLEAQRDGVMARIEVATTRIEYAHIRAPRDGVILVGELREKLGARLPMGETLFELARYDGAMVRMSVPEQLVMAAREAQHLEFVATATPDTPHVLRAFTMAPASSTEEGKNVFVAEAELAETIEGLPPGVEGFALLDVGPRNATWVLTHRIFDWLHLNFWL